MMWLQYCIQLVLLVTEPSPAEACVFDHTVPQQLDGDWRVNFAEDKCSTCPECCGVIDL